MFITLFMTSTSRENAYVVWLGSMKWVFGPAQGSWPGSGSLLWSGWLSSSSTATPHRYKQIQYNKIQWCFRPKTTQMYTCFIHHIKYDVGFRDFSVYNIFLHLTLFFYGHWTIDIYLTLAAWPSMIFVYFIISFFFQIFCFQYIFIIISNSLASCGWLHPWLYILAK